MSFVSMHINKKIKVVQISTVVHDGNVTIARFSVTYIY